MVSIKNYKIEFVQRTKEILEEYHHFEEKDREATFLLNCLLGLIVTISESEKRKNVVFKGNIDETFLELIPDKIGFIEKKSIKEDLTDEDLTKLTLDIGHKTDLKNKSKFWFINKIRNAIAHQNIEGVNNENDEWIGVRLWNLNNRKKDFEVIFTLDSLKNFAEKISGFYLENFVDTDS